MSLPRAGLFGRWLSAILACCMYGVIACVLAAGAVALLYAVVQKFLGKTDTTTMQAIGLAVLAIVVAIFSLGCVMALWSIVRYTLPAIAALRRLADIPDDGKLAEHGQQLAFAIRHCGQPLSRRTTRPLITTLVQRFSQLRPDVIDADTVAKNISLYDDSVAEWELLVQNYQSRKKSVKRQGILGKLLFGVLGNAMAFQQVYSAEKEVLEPLEKGVSEAKKKVVEMDEQFSKRVADLMDKGLASKTEAVSTDGGH